MKPIYNTFFRLSSLLLLASLLFVSNQRSLKASAAATEPISISARSACLYEANTQTVLYEKNADIRMGPASTTKIVTAILVIEHMALDDAVEITEEMAGVEGSSLYLKAGECLSVRDLLYGLMLRSANDAAVALAIHTSGSLGAFVEEMNAFAARLELVNTHFDNPHGLDGNRHYTTARELAKIAAYASKNETFREIAATKKIIIAKGSENARLVVNHNKLLCAYDGCVGIKTGFTKKCGRTLVSACAEGGMYLIGVTLNAPDDWNDHKKLFDHAKASYQMTEALLPFGYTKALTVLGGDRDTVRVSNADGAMHLEKRSASPYSISVTLPRMLVAPIQKGETVGVIRIEYADGTTKDIPLTAEHTVLKRKHHFFK